MGETKVRNIDEGAYPIEPNYYKFFTWNRTYNIRWDFTKSLSIDYTANNNSRIDEPYGKLDTSEKGYFLAKCKQIGRNTGYNQFIKCKLQCTLN